MFLSVVTTVYHSEQYLDEFHRQVVLAASGITSDFEVIFVNDGSRDKSLDKLRELGRRHSHVRVINLSRNFGHHKAIMTGLVQARGKYVFFIDCDLEESPSLLREFWDALDDETDVVFGIQHSRKGGRLEKAFGRVFYWILNKMLHVDYPADMVSARLMRRQYVEQLSRFPEKDFDLWVLFALTGFRQKGIRVAKADKGSTTYTWRRKFALAINTITSASSKPLYLVLIAGLLTVSASFLILFFLFFQRSLQKEPFAKMDFLIFSGWFLSGVILTGLGITSTYIAKIFTEVKNRPYQIHRTNEHHE